jgi:L-aspartate oxidase
VHGANRLASNSLLEGLVYGARAAAAMQATARSAVLRAGHVVEIGTWQPAASIPSEARIRDVMWRQAGLVRDRAGLEDAVQVLGPSWCTVRRAVDAAPRIERSLRRLESLVTVALVIAQSALQREESRGGHFRADFPRRDDIHWKKHFAVVSGSQHG